MKSENDNAELNARNSLARHLRALGVGPRLLLGSALSLVKWSSGAGTTQSGVATFRSIRFPGAVAFEEVAVSRCAFLSGLSQAYRP